MDIDLQAASSIRWRRGSLGRWHGPPFTRAWSCRWPAACEGGRQLGTAPQVLQHVGVCSHDAGCICVTHQDPEEQQVRGAEARAGPSLQDSRSA